MGGVTRLTISITVIMMEVCPGNHSGGPFIMDWAIPVFQLTLPAEITDQHKKM